MKTVYKKKIAITGSSGLLGSYFCKKFSKKYEILKYPHRIEKINKFNEWLTNKKFEYFIHFAGITRGTSSKLTKINFDSSINIIRCLKKNNNLKFFLFISTSHVYGYSNKKINEGLKTKPINKYGLSKKKTEDFILKNRKKFKFKIGIARIFNVTGPAQRSGYFVSDIFKLISKNKYIDNINCYRDFIHIDDIMDSIKIIITKQFEKTINISSGKKINLIDVCEVINTLYFNKKIKYGTKGGKNLFGDNKLLKSIGKKKFKNIKEIIRSFKK